MKAGVEMFDVDLDETRLAMCANDVAESPRRHRNPPPNIGVGDVGRRSKRAECRIAMNEKVQLTRRLGDPDVQDFKVVAKPIGESPSRLLA